ncbi:DUF4231 domain-containing protein [Nonomuraea sp. SYSU D8015]|uniref:DUF4231 domain-containing protein n=1 Tax=Nonomuraea sp. SYSU D8015 TaxID=2593644 RepID=UPI001660407D|nr:DUF4231 domain-containing protein [Nonomuraea sp. SYSU D8015]
MTESVATIKEDVTDVNFQIYRTEEELRRARFKRSTAAAGVLIIVLLASAGAATYALLPHARTLLPLWALTAIGVVLLGGASALIIYTGRRQLEVFKKERDLAEYRETLRSLRRRAPSNDPVAILEWYHEDAILVIDDYRTNANRYRRVHNAFQSIIIIGSIITTAVTSAAGQIPLFGVLAPFISIIVGISAGMTGYFKFRERSLNLQQTADDIEHEHNAAALGIEGYRRAPSRQEALVDFAERVERLKDEQRKREQQLEQPPDAARQRTASE